MKYDSCYIFTYSGCVIDPIIISPNDIIIEDIAHALSFTGRANGHFKYLFSVAQHCINCTIEAKNRGLKETVQLACLLHDACECYISDIARPMKELLHGYYDIENRIINVINQKFGLYNLSKKEIEKVSEIDNAMPYYEFINIMGIEICKAPPYISMEHDFSCKESEIVEAQYLSMFYELVNRNTKV